ETERLDLETDAGFLDRVAADPVVVRMRAERAEARQVHPEVPVREPVVRDEEVAGLLHPDADAARAAGEGVAGEGVARDGARGRPGGGRSDEDPGRRVGRRRWRGDVVAGDLQR